MEYARVTMKREIIGDRIFDKWNGKIVQVEAYHSYCNVWSLEGKQDEGLGLTLDYSQVNELNEQEMIIAELLGATFFHRDFYTEDFNTLKNIKI